jgi:hypothetical protein
MGKTWVKLYVADLLDDPAVASLSWEHRGMLVSVLALAGKLDVRDEDGVETGQVDAPANVAWYLRCSEQALAEAVAEWEKRGLVCQREGVLFLEDYAARQGRPASASREAVNERVKRHRAAKRNEGVTSTRRDVTPSDSESDSEQHADPDAASATDAADASGLDDDDYDGDDDNRCERCTCEAAFWLSKFGVAGSLAEELVQEHGPRNVMFWCAHVAARTADRNGGVRNPAGLIINQLNRGLEPPLPPARDDVWFIVCQKECAGHPAVRRPEWN